MKPQLDDDEDYSADDADDADAIEGYEPDICPH